MTIKLIDGVKHAAEHPSTFEVPSAREKAEQVKPGSYVKVGVVIDPPVGAVNGERLWVKVTMIDGNKVSGTWGNDPEFFDAALDDPVELELRHVLSIIPAPTRH